MLFGRFHKRPDLTMLSGYECQILRMVGLSKEDTSVSRWALWWKTYITITILIQLYISNHHIHKYIYNYFVSLKLKNKYSAMFIIQRT